MSQRRASSEQESAASSSGTYSIPVTHFACTTCGRAVTGSGDVNVAAVCKASSHADMVCCIQLDPLQHSRWHVTMAVHHALLD